MKKIIHLSDLHVGYEDLSTKLGDLVTRMIYHKTPSENYVVVVTGDLVDDATREGSYEEASAHLDRLSAAGFKVLVVPGNHDNGTGSLASPEFVGRFKEYFFGCAEVTYPKLDIVDGVAFIGLDSMTVECGMAGGASGGCTTQGRRPARKGSPDPTVSSTSRRAPAATTTRSSDSVSELSCSDRRPIRV